MDELTAGAVKATLTPLLEEFERAGLLTIVRNEDGTPTHIKDIDAEGIRKMLDEEGPRG